MFDKRSAALAALRAAEMQTGVTPVVELNGPPPQGAADGAIPPLQVEVELTSLPLLAEVAKLFPDQRISAGSVISVQGSRQLLYRMLAAASQSGTWVAIVGEPDVVALAFDQSGLILERVALVPDPGVDAAITCAALLEGMCVVVGTGIKFSAAEQRRLAARARERGNVIFCETPWAGAQLSFQVLSQTWQGANQGEGWLQTTTFLVERTGRGLAVKPVRVEVDL